MRTTKPKRDKHNKPRDMWNTKKTNQDWEDARILAIETGHHINGTAILLITLIIISITALTISMRVGSQVTESINNITNYVKRGDTGTPGRTQATENVYQWLNNSENPPFPTGIDSYQYVRGNKVKEWTDNNGDNNSWWSHEFTILVHGSNIPRTISQLVQVTNNIPTVIGQPTILPIQAAGETNTMISKPNGYRELDPTPTISSMVESWSKAYLSTDSNALTVLVSDPNSEHAYAPAGLGEWVSSSADWMVASTSSGEPAGDEEAQNPDYAIAQISINFKPTGSERATVGTQMLVLVKNPTSGSARIVDWGSNGAVTTLRPFAHAVDKTMIPTFDDENKISQLMQQKEQNNDGQQQ